MAFTKNEIDDYRNRLTEEQKELVVKHANNTDVPPVICAWYDDLDDFYSDWVEEIGYSKEEADELLKDEEQFLIFEDGSIIRFVI